MSLEKTLQLRRSVRHFHPNGLTLADISQLLWSSQGVTDARGLRTAPSAGALYPLEIYLAAGSVSELPAGVYHYGIRQHCLVPAASGDVRPALCRIALHQQAVASAAATIAVCAVARRMTGKYGHRGIRYVHMEAGHAAQNICLQAVALHLAAVVIGAFRDQDLRQLLALPPEREPLYLIPVGRPA